MKFAKEARKKEITEQVLDAVVEAVRDDPKIGKGTCSVIDECWSAEEIKEWAVEVLGRKGCWIDSVVQSLREVDRSFWERDAELDAALRW